MEEIKNEILNSFHEIYAHNLYCKEDMCREEECDSCLYDSLRGAVVRIFEKHLLQKKKDADVMSEIFGRLKEKNNGRADKSF